MRIPLTQLRRGGSGRVSCVANLAPDDAAMLRAMGLAEDASVRLCRCSSSCIVELGGRAAGRCRIAVGRTIADCILVEPAEPGG